MATKNALHPIPNPPGRPVVGNAFSVDASTPLQSLMEIARKEGPIFWLNMMGRPVIFVSGAELCKELFDERRFDKAVRGALRRVRVIAGDALFTGETQEPNWAKAHHILLPTFSQRAMVDYMPMMVDVATQLCLKWERLNAEDEIDVVRDMTGLALDTIGLCGFDYRFNSYYRRDFHPFIDALTRTLETCMMQRGLPFEKAVLKKRLDQLDEDAAFMNKLVDDIVRERRRGGGRGQKDLLNYMLAGVDKVTGESLSDENIRFQINTFLIAGHETTSGLLSFTLYFLLNNPGVLAKAYEEVDRVLGRDVATAPSYAQVNQLEYVRAILLESLRLWPTAPAFSVYPYEDETIGGEYRLKKGAFINVLTLMLHRDKSVWGEDAEAFNPENFTREAEARRPVYAYKPFGNGQRACIGRQFAMQEATLVIGMLLQRFELIDHSKYELRIKESLSIKPEGFKMRARLRSDVTRSKLVPAGTPEKPVAPIAKARPRPTHGAPLTVLYGSNLGATESFAREIAQAGAFNGFRTTLAPLDDYAGRPPTEGAVVIASASYNGAPPDNATKFVAWLKDAPEGAAKGVSYAVFGCGNRDWASTFQAVPRFIDERLAALGAKRIALRGEGDAREDLDGEFHAWFDGLWPQVGDAMGLKIDFSAPVEAEPLYRIEFVEKVNANPVANLTGARPMRVLANRELQNVAASGRSTRHIEIELPEGVAYKPGDHLCVVAPNAEETVARAMARFGFTDEDYIKLTPTGGRRSAFPANSAVSVRAITERYGELQAVASRKDIALLARHTRCPVTKGKLEALAAPPANGADPYRNEILLKRKSVLDLLEEFPAAELPFNVTLEMIPWMAPRYYSISSSPRMDPGRCTITVGVVEGPARSGRGVFRGVASSHLASLREGDMVQAVIKESTAGFRPPEDISRPVIMIGPGTGLAPFRGFIEERAVLKKAGARLGPAMLFFGCRAPDQDFLYAEELKAAAETGLVDLCVAYSRAGGERQYVQDLIRKERDKVWRLITDDAVIYVCGDGARMEPDVKRALGRIYAEEKDLDEEAGEAWLNGLSAEGRYNLDVWAGG